MTRAPSRDTGDLTPLEIEAIASDALRLMSQRGDLVLNAVDEGIYCLDAAGRTTFVNEAATRMLGYTLREMIGRRQHELIHHHYADGSEFPADACPIWSSVTEGVHQRVGGDVFWRKDGSALPVDYTSVPIREGRRVVAVVVTFRDATAEIEARSHGERLAAERAAREEAERGRAALQESEERFRVALEAGQMGTWEWDIVGQRVYWSPQEERMYGLAEGSFTGSLEEYRERIHPDDREASMRAVTDAIARRAPTHHVMHRIVRPGGEVRWLDSHARFVYDDDGRPLRLSGVSADVTEREHLNARIQQRDDRMRALIAASGQIVWTNSSDGQMTGEQPGWSGYTGQPREEYEGYGWADAVHPDDRDATVAAWNAAVRDRRMFEHEHRVRGRDGEYRRFAIRAVPVLDAQGAIVEWVGSHTDVTEQRALEAGRDLALREAQRAREELLRIFDQAPAAIATMEGPSHIIRTANPGFRIIVGDRDMIGRPVREAFPDLEGQPFFGLLDRVFQTGEAFVGQNVEARVDRGSGVPEPGLFNFVYQPLRDASGQVSGIMVHAIEVARPAS